MIANKNRMLTYLKTQEHPKIHDQWGKNILNVIGFK